MKRLFAFLALSLCFADCAGQPYREPGKGDRIGVLGVSGSNVSHNDRRAKGGETVRVGDTVTTGEDSSAIIDFDDGGFFQLDENTDPLFVVQRLQSGFCILIRMLKGQAFVDKQRFCIETPALDAASGSRINIRVTPKHTGIVVLQGNVSVSRPLEMRVKSGQQVSMDIGDKPQMRNLSERELARFVRWRDNYTFLGWCCTDNKVHSADHEQCPAGSFSFDKVPLEERCVPRFEPSSPIDFGLPVLRPHRSRGGDSPGDTEEGPPRTAPSPYPPPPK
jgi:FecR protein